MSLGKSLLLLIALLFTHFVHGQKVWTLEESVEKALNSSIAIQQAHLNTLNSEINLDVAKQARNPNLNASINASWNFGRTIDPTSNEFITETFFSNNYGLSTGILLYDGLRIKNNIAKSKIDLEAAQADTKQSKQDIALQVALNYLNILFSKENIDIAKKQLQLTEQQLDQIDKSIKAGALPAAERLNLEAQIAQSEQGIIVAENTYELALLQLKQYLRLPPEDEISVKVPTEFDVTTDVDLLTYDELLKSAIKNRYDLIAADLRTESAEKDIQIAKAGYHPRLSMFGSLGSNYSNQAKEIVGFNQSLEEQAFIIQGMDVTVGQMVNRPILGKPSFGTQLDNFLSYGFGLGLSIPIYNNGINKANVERGELNVIGQKLMKDQLIENFKINLQSSLADARAAKKKLDASEKSVAAQKAAFENASKRLEIGATNTFEWETQKTQLENLEISKLNDKYDYLFKIKIIEFYLGKPLKF